MFDSLSEKLQSAFSRLRGKGKVTEADVNEAMREVRLALLEADVSLKVVRDFVGKVKEKALGAEVLESLQPWQQVVGIVNDELIALLGGEESTINLNGPTPTVIMLCGLQGAGKTTLTGKLGLYFKKQGRNPLLAAYLPTCRSKAASGARFSNFGTRLRVRSRKPEVTTYDRPPGR